VRIGLSTNLISRGLLKDTKIFQEAAGPEHEYILFQDFEKSDIRVDLMVYFETINTKILANAPFKYLVPNMEFMNEEQLDVVRGTCIDKVLCKTSDAYSLLSENVGKDKTVYVGFCSADMYEPKVKKKNVFLHVAGKSQHRNTQAVLDAWREHKINYPLIVISQYFKEDIPNVTFMKDVKEEDLIHLMNECKYHILPSEYEGFGHALHEAQLVGAQILCKEMEERNGQFLVPGVSGKRQGQTTLQLVSSNDLAQMVEIMIKHPMPSLRKKCLKEGKEFKERLCALLSSVTSANTQPRPKSVTPCNI
jgi:glycosyltransferase involved in cell wall biosynthesis